MTVEYDQVKIIGLFRLFFFFFQIRYRFCVDRWLVVGDDDDDNDDYSYDAWLDF